MGSARAIAPDRPRGFWSLPSSRPGRVSVALGALFLVLFAINAAVLMRATTAYPWQQVLLPAYGLMMLLAGLGAGILALVAIARHGERSSLVWLTLLPGLLVLALLVGEILVPH
jgi:hypothetical protein